MMRSNRTDRDNHRASDKSREDPRPREYLRNEKDEVGHAKGSPGDSHKA